MGDTMKQVERDRACDTYGREERQIQGFGG